MKKLLPIIFVSLLFYSCVSEPAIIIDTPESMTFENNHFKIVFDLLTKDESMEKHGRISTGNPFISFPALITHKDVIIYEAYIESKGLDLIFSPNDVILQIEVKQTGALSQHQYLQLWDTYINEDYRNNLNLLIQRNMFKDTIYVNQDEPARDYFVFLSNMPEEGDTSITISYKIAGEDRTREETFDLGYFIQEN